LRMFLVGPFQWRIRDGKWKFEFLLARFFSAGGATAVVPTNPKQSKWIYIALIAAGPAASLAAGLISLLLVFSAKGRPYEQAWELFALCAVLSLAAVLVNLIPMRPESFYSDGAQIYQLITGGPWADLHQAISVVQASVVTPLRPRDYDIAAIQRAELFFVRGHQALILRLIASFYYQDIGDCAEAASSISEANRIFDESPFEIRPETQVAIVFQNAFLRRDANSARTWWDRMEAKKPTHFGVDYWLARSALLWVEGNLTEAREAWEKGNALAQRLPDAGDYNFDRDRATKLRQALDAVPSRAIPAGSELVAPM
jgi:Zn-dependent protease